MKVVILNGSDKEYALNHAGEMLALELENKGWDVESYQLSKVKIATCIGCYGCWLKTPGQCILKDTGQEIAEKVIKSDLLIMLSPVTFGGYSFHLKKVVDRLIPNILPFFTRIDGELHHKPRYEKNPKFLAIGYLPHHNEESENIFTALVNRNAINMHSPENYAEVINGDKSDLNGFNANLILEKVGVVL
jgi:multimeric flavodoxin WrbA